MAGDHARVVPRTVAAPPARAPPIWPTSMLLLMCRAIVRVKASPCCCLPLCVAQFARVDIGAAQLTAELPQFVALPFVLLL